jgi:hypothetical protein
MRRVGRESPSISFLPQFPNDSSLVAQAGKGTSCTRGMNSLANGLIVLVLSTLVPTMCFCNRESLSSSSKEIRDARPK